MSCCECEILNAKYKCPICLLSYCSVACCRLHKEKTCCPAPMSLIPKCVEIPIQTYDFPTKDTVPLEKLELLGRSNELKKCLENPHLRKLLDDLDTSLSPDVFIGKLMQEPIFTEFVDECLKVVEPEEEDSNR